MNITDTDILAATATAGLDKTFVREAIDQMREIAREENALLTLSGL